MDHPLPPVLWLAAMHKPVRWTVRVSNSPDDVAYDHSRKRSPSLFCSLIAGRTMPFRMAVPLAFLIFAYAPHCRCSGTPGSFRRGVSAADPVRLLKRLPEIQARCVGIAQHACLLKFGHKAIDDAIIPRGIGGVRADHQEAVAADIVHRCDHLVGNLPGSPQQPQFRSEEHTSELQSLMRISYAVFCLKKKKLKTKH